MVCEHTQGSLGGASGGSSKAYGDNVVPGDCREEEQGGGVHRADGGGQKVVGGLQTVLVGDAVENSVVLVLAMSYNQRGRRRQRSENKFTIDIILRWS